jgi:LPS export ABC transporter protein LptC
MIRLNRRGYAAATVAVVVGAALLLRPWQQDGPMRVDTSGLDDDTPVHDSFARDIHTSLYNSEGQLQYTVQADSQMTYGNYLTELTAPVIRLFEDAVLRWDVSADRGRILGDSSSASGIEQMELINRVNVVHSDQDGFLLRMQTGYLVIEPDSEILRTNQRVYIDGDGFTQQATGMIADLSLDRLTFLSDLEGRYDNRRGH